MNALKSAIGNIKWEQLVISSAMSMEDLPQVMEIERTTIYSPWSKDMFRQEINDKNPGLISFKCGAKLIGYFCFWKVLNEAHLLNLSVNIDFRGRGVGQFIMNQLEITCNNMDISLILLEVAETNYAAIKLYKECGFVHTGIRKKFYIVTGDDAIIMEKRLQRS